MSTVSGPSPMVAFGIGDGFCASLPAGHVLKIALVTMSHIRVVLSESVTLALM